MLSDNFRLFTCARLSDAEHVSGKAFAILGRGGFFLKGMEFHFQRHYAFGKTAFDRANLSPESVNDLKRRIAIRDQVIHRKVLSANL